MSDPLKRKQILEKLKEQEPGEGFIEAFDLAEHEMMQRNPLYQTYMMNGMYGMMAHLHEKEKTVKLRDHRV